MTAADSVDYEDLPPTASTLTHLTAGALAGILEHTVAFPLDMIKTRMQVAHSSPAAHYDGVLQAFHKISSTEGIAKLWRGVLSVALGAGPSHAIFYASYESSKFFLTNNHHAHDAGSSAISGMVAAALSEAFMNPFDVIKQRMQVHGSEHRNTWECAKSVLKNEGFRAFYVSYPTTLVLAVPFHAVQFSAYEAAKFFMNPDHKYDPISHVTSGAIAGGVAAAITTPIDVIKTTLQTRTVHAHPDLRNASGMREAFRAIYSVHGASGFFRGLVPRVVSFMPSTAICWTVYEYFKFLLGFSYQVTSNNNHNH